MSIQSREDGAIHLPLSQDVDFGSDQEIHLDADEMQEIVCLWVQSLPVEERKQRFGYITKTYIESIVNKYGKWRVDMRMRAILPYLEPPVKE